MTINAARCRYPAPPTPVGRFPLGRALHSRKRDVVKFNDLVEGVLAEGHDAFDGIYTKLMDLSVASMSAEKPRLAIAYARLARVFRDFATGRAEAIREIVKEMDN